MCVLGHDGCEGWVLQLDNINQTLRLLPGGHDLQICLELHILGFRFPNDWSVMIYPYGPLSHKIVCNNHFYAPCYKALLDFPHGWWADLDFNFWPCLCSSLLYQWEWLGISDLTSDYIQIQPSNQWLPWLFLYTAVGKFLVGWLWINENP